MCDDVAERLVVQVPSHVYRSYCKRLVHLGDQVRLLKQ